MGPWGTESVTWQTCTPDTPFVNLEHARQQVRLFIWTLNRAPRDVVVHVAGAKYVIKEPIIFDAKDSGWANHPIKYIAWDRDGSGTQYDADVFVSGEYRLLGWTDSGLRTPANDIIWVCTVPTDVPDPRDLYMNRYRLLRSRFPDLLSSAEQNACNAASNYVSWWRPPTSCRNKQFLVVKSVVRQPGSPNKQVVELGNSADTAYTIPPGVGWNHVEAVSHWLYVSARQTPSAGAVLPGSIVRLDFPITEWHNPAFPSMPEQDMGAFGPFDFSQVNPDFQREYLALAAESGGINDFPTQVYLENDVKFITQQYEWSFNPQTRQMHLALCTDPDLVEIVAPRPQQLVILDGTADLLFQGLDFGINAMPMPTLADGATSGYSSIQSGLQWVNTPPGPSSPYTPNVRPGAIVIRGSIDCTLTDCKIGHTGASAISIEPITGPALSIENHLITIDHCELLDLGGHGVWIGDQAALLDDWTTTGLSTKAEPHTTITVKHSYIHNYGRVYKDAVGIGVQHTRLNTLENNEISYGNWSGISVGSFQGHQWPYPGSGTASCQASRPQNNDGLAIMRNHIHHTNIRLFDGGGIYLQGTAGTIGGVESTLDGNFVNDLVLNPYFNTPASSQTQVRASVKGIQWDTGSDGWRVANNYIARATLMFQFNTAAGSASAPPPTVEPFFGGAVWPVAYPHACPGSSGDPYSLPGMTWPVNAGNKWLRPSISNTAYALWTDSHGNTGMPTSPGQNDQIAVEDAAAQAIRLLAGPTVAFPNWLGGGERIYQTNPIAPCTLDYLPPELPAAPDPEPN